MSYEDLIEVDHYKLFSKKTYEKLLALRNAGRFFAEDADSRGMCCIQGQAGSLSEGEAVAFYALVDLSDGMIVDAKFQAFGPTALLCAADALTELVLGKNYDQAKRIGADLIDKKLRDHSEVQAYPDEARRYHNLCLEALDIATQSCEGIPLGDSYVSPVPRSEGEGEGYPGWQDLTSSQKLAVIEEVLNVDVRPYVELDDGGIVVQELVNETQLVIAYEGSCTSCFSAIGATLSTIQNIVQTKIHPSLTVVPNMDSLNL